MYPYNMDHTLYPVLASHMGIGNYPVHATNGSRLWSRYPEYFKYNCDEVAGVAVSWRHPWCRAGTMNFAFRIEPRDFESALVNAVQHTGHRLRFRNMRPQKVAGTKTGYGR